LDRGAAILKVDCIATGHNADDIAETVLMNILRGDIARLQRCTSVITVRISLNTCHMKVQRTHTHKIFDIYIFM